MQHIDNPPQPWTDLLGIDMKCKVMTCSGPEGTALIAVTQTRAATQRRVLPARGYAQHSVGPGDPAGMHPHVLGGSLAV